MPVNLSIKGVPDAVAEALRRQAAAHHRSLQGELMVMLEERTGAGQPLTANALLAEVRAMKLTTPAEATEVVRKERDRRARR